MVIYTVLAKNQRIEKIEKIKKPRNNFWGPCQVLNILSRTPFYQFHKEHPKNTKF